MGREVKPNNPAGRLWMQLDAIRKYGGGTGRVGAMLLNVFGVPNEDFLGYMSEMISLDLLLQEVEREIKTVDHGYHEAFTEAAGRIRQALAQPSLQMQWLEFAGRFRSEDLTALQFVSMRLEQKGAETLISKEDLDNLFIEVSELLEMITNAEISFELKIFLLDGVRKLQDAIIGYKYRGIRGIEEAVAEIVGQGLLHPEIQPEQGEKPEPKGWRKKLWDVVAHAGSASRSPRCWPR